MSPDNAFHHLPELQGRLTPAHASGLRLTDEVLHDEVGAAIGHLSDVEDVNQVFMADLIDRERLSLEARDRLGVG